MLASQCTHSECFIHATRDVVPHHTVHQQICITSRVRNPDHRFTSKFWESVAEGFGPVDIIWWKASARVVPEPGPCRQRQTRPYVWHCIARCPEIVVSPIQQANTILVFIIRDKYESRANLPQFPCKCLLFSSRESGSSVYFDREKQGQSQATDKNSTISFFYRCMTMWKPSICFKMSYKARHSKNSRSKVWNTFTSEIRMTLQVMGLQGALFSALYYPGKSGCLHCFYMGRH